MLHSVSENKQFAEPGIYTQLICNGRHCRRCGRCRDWYYTGNQASWRWIQNVNKWNDEDCKRWYDGQVRMRFKRRNGATCIDHRIYDDDRFIRRHRDIIYDHYCTCLCDDNIN